jgi:hypothetical protein
MALGSDVRDILELEGPEEKDDYMTKEALFNDSRKVGTADLLRLIFLRYMPQC